MDDGTGPEPGTPAQVGSGRPAQVGSGTPAQVGSGTAGRTVRPTPPELAAWRAFLRAHASLIRRLEEDLLAERQLPLAMYDVLVQLVEAPDHRLRMTDLAQAVLLSRSGLTRLVDRMVRAGDVRREPSPRDARGVYAVLTEQGYARLRAASSTHLRGVFEYVVQRLDAAELSALGQACDKLLIPDPALATGATE